MDTIRFGGGSCSLITTATCAGINPWSHHAVLDTIVSLLQSRRNGGLEAHTSCEVWPRAEARLVRPRCARHSCCSDGQLLAYSAAKRRPATACLRTQFGSLVTTLQRKRPVWTRNKPDFDSEPARFWTRNKPRNKSSLLVTSSFRVILIKKS